MYKNKLLSIKSDSHNHPIYNLELPAKFGNNNIVREISKILLKEQKGKKEMIKRMAEEERYEWEFLLSKHKRNIIKLKILSSLLAA